MDPEQHLPLAPRDLLVLSVLAEGPLHGYGIIKAVEGRSQAGVLLDPANLYRLLRRMRRLGWIREASGARAPQPGRWKEKGGISGGAGSGRVSADPERVSAGPGCVSAGPGCVSAETPGGGGISDGRRRTYKITTAGRSLLAAEIARLERLLTHVRPALADGEGS